jgi:plastocyanin
VRLRRRHVLLVAAAGIAVGLLSGPAHSQAPPSTAALVAHDFDGDPNRWVAANGSNSVKIAAGGTVSFSYPSGTLEHNAAFQGAKPRACSMTAGSSNGPVPPLPSEAKGPGWAGRCTFDAGIYQAYCTVHNGMTAKIEVVGTGTPPPTTQPGGTPPGPAGSSIGLKRAQRGNVIRGSLQVARASSRLDVRALVRRSLLSDTKRSGRVRVARQLRPSVGGRRVAFTLRLNAKARRALKREGRLAVRLEIRVNPLAGASYVTHRSVTQRPNT